MKSSVFVTLACVALVSSGWAVNVAQDGSGDFTSIQAALDSGATEITITDSGVYDEIVMVGNQASGGDAVTITSTQSGDQRPVISPSSVSPPLIEPHRWNNGDRGGGFMVFASGSVISNVIVEGLTGLDPAGSDNGNCAVAVVADDVIIENCLFRPRAGGDGEVKYPNTLVFFGQEADGPETPKLGGRTSNGCIMRNCEFVGVASDKEPEPTESSLGYLARVDVGQAATLSRMDHFTGADQDVTITYEGCAFKYSYDAGIFPSNRNADGVLAGSLNLVFRNCTFDAFGKFAVRTRGANVDVECSVFSRTNQNNNGDGENSAIAIQKQSGRTCDASVKNTLFVNCGGAFAQKAFYGGCNNHGAGDFTVDQCTFVSCLNGVSISTGDAATTMTISNSVLHNIGSNQPIPTPVDFEGIAILPSHPDNVNGLYPVWDLGRINFGENPAAAFNHTAAGDPTLFIDNCLVGDIASEDTRGWQEFLDAAEITGARLWTGFDGAEDEVRGLATVTRGVPQFANTDLGSDRPYDLAPGSPGAGLGVDWDACAGTGVGQWSLF